MCLVPLFISAIVTFITVTSSRRGSLAFILIYTILLFPWWLVLRVAVPLGLYGQAYHFSRLARFVWRHDKPGGPALAAAWVLARKKSPSAFSIKWVEERLAQATVLQASVVAAHGFLAAATSDRAEAKRQLESVFAFEEGAVTSTTLRLAASWLATDAAARGEWARVLEVTTNRRTPFSRTLWLLDAIARRHVGKPVTNGGLWYFWLLAPRRLSTVSMVRRTAAMPEGVPPEVVIRRKFVGASTPLDRALLVQTSAVDRTLPAAELLDIARLWEKAFSDTALRVKLAERAQNNGGGDPASALDELRQLVAAELTPRMPTQLEEVQKLGSLPTLLVDAMAARCDDLMADLERQVDQLDRRREQSRALPSADEWREMTRFIEGYRTVCSMGDLDHRALMHSMVRDRLCSFGVWQCNVRHEKTLAAVIFRFLEKEGAAVGDTASAELNRNNAACCS